MKTIAFFDHWDGVRAGLLETVEKFEPEQLHFRPFAGSFSVAEIMLHIADAEDGWLRYVVTRELSGWPDSYTVANYPTFDPIRSVLESVHANTKAYIASLAETDLQQPVKTPWGATMSVMQILWHVLEHEIHHRGELSLILGMLGKEGLDV